MVKSWFGRYRCEICGRFVNPGRGCACGETNPLYFREEDEDKWLTRDKVLGV